MRGDRQQMRVEQRGKTYEFPEVSARYPRSIWKASDLSSAATLSWGMPNSGISGRAEQVTEPIVYGKKLSEY